MLLFQSFLFLLKASQLSIGSFFLGQGLSSLFFSNLSHILILLLLKFVLVLKFSHDLLSLIIFSFDLLQLVQFVLDFVLILLCLLQILPIFTLDLPSLFLSILQGFLSELLFSFQFSDKVPDFLLIFEVFGVIVDLSSFDLFSLDFLFLQIPLIFIVLSLSVFLSPHTSLSLFVDLLLDSFETILKAVLLKFFVSLQQLAALALQSV